MLTFRNKEEEEFWKEMVVVCATFGGSWPDADFAVEQLRLRQPVQQFPEIKD